MKNNSRRSSAYPGPTPARRAADERWREKQAESGIMRVSIPMDAALLEELDRRAKHLPGNAGQRRALLIAELLGRIVAEGKAVLSLLNLTAGREFKPTQANLKPICGRLGEGYTPDDLALVIAQKTAQWGQDLKMAAYLQPSTLFCAQKFGGYLEAARIWERGGRTE